MKAKSLICLSVSAVLVSACSSTSIAPVAGNLSTDEICIIPDVSDRKVAYSSTIKALTAKGFTVREVSSANTSDCSKVISLSLIHICMHYEALLFYLHLSFASNHFLEFYQAQ